MKVVLTMYLPFDTFSKIKVPSDEEIMPFTRLESVKFNKSTFAFATVFSVLSTIIPWMRDCPSVIAEISWTIKSRKSPDDFGPGSILVKYLTLSYVTFNT